MSFRLFRTLLVCVFLVGALITNGSALAVGPNSMYVPMLKAFGAAEVGLALVNPTTLPVEIIATAHDYHGAVIQADAVTNPVRLTLPAFQQRQFRTSELFGAGIQSQTGWIEISASTRGVRGFFIAYDSNQAGMDGGELTRETSSQIVFSKVASDAIAPTQLTFVNTAADAIEVQVSLYSNDGGLVSSSTMPMAARSGFSGGVAELWSSPSDFDGYVVITSSAGSLIGFESYRRNSDFALVRGLPISAQMRNGYLAHFIAGGGYSTHLVLVNATSLPQQVRITAHGGATATVERTLPANGRLEEPVGAMFGLDSAASITGYIHFETETPTDGVFGVLDYGPTTQTALAAVEAEGERYSDLVFSHFAGGDGLYTGFALLNPNNQSSSVTVEVFNAQGLRTAAADVKLEAGEHQTHTVGEFLPDAANQTGGFVHLTATRPIVAMELFGTRDALSLANAPGQGERLIPQLSGRAVRAARGANVVSTFGSSLLLPPDALSSDTLVALTPVTVNGMAGVQLSPTGTKLQTPARLRFELTSARTPGSSIAIWMKDTATQQYIQMPQQGLVDATGKAVSIDVTSLTAYVAAAGGELGLLPSLQAADAIMSAPTDVSLEPKAATAGSPVELHVSGTGFQAGSIVRYDGKSIPFEFVDSTLLAVNLSSAQLTRGFHRIEVGNAAGGFSDAVELSVNAAGNEPAPPLSVAAAPPTPIMSESATTSAAVTANAVNLPTGIVAAYGFNEGAGLTAADSSSNGLTGFLINGADWTGGVHGGALQLSGVYEYVDLGNSTPLQITGSMTISAWINSSTFPFDDAVIVSKRNNIGYQLDTTVDTGSRTIGFKLTNSYGDNMIRYGSTSLQPNTWHHVAGVYDAAAATMNVYLNGQLDNGVLLGAVTNAQQNSYVNLSVGQRSGWEGIFNFAGGIDDLRIYSRPLSPAEIQSDMNAAVGTAVNQRPLVSAGSDQTIILPAAANLTGAVSDDGLPAGSRITSSWAKVSGPGAVTFGSVSAPSTTASFSLAGSYVLRLTASDGEFTTSDDVTIVVNSAIGNQPPVVNAGSNQTITLPAGAALSGTASDDGLPSGSLTTTWSSVSGPGAVTFSNTASLNSTASFSAAGSYVLRLTASDGALSSSSDVTISVNAQAAAPGVLVAAFALDEGAGLTAADSSGNGITGALSNGAAWTASGRHSNSLLLDGRNDFVDLGNPAPLQITGSLTISAWINSSSFPADDAVVVSKRGNRGFQLDTTVDAGPRTIGFKLTNSLGADMIRYGATAMQANTWYHIAGVYDAAKATMDVYLNGQLDNGALSGVVTNSQQDSTRGVNIGQRAGQAALFNFAGAIDDVRIYSRALSPAENQNDMASAVGAVVTPNQAPVVDAGADQTITLPNVANFRGAATDDGLPSGASLTTAWSKVSGPGTVSFGDANALITTASFSLAGSYRLRLTATDSALTTSSDVAITVNPLALTNQAPIVDAGANQTITLPAAANLSGTASDDGLPAGSTLTTAWSKVSGPGTVSFGAANALITTASFSLAGSYTLRLTATDSALTTSSDVAITVNPLALTNQAPIVDAGANQTITLPAAANLSGTASDDGLPAGSTLTTTWSKVSGPGSVVFSAANALSTSATFSTSGAYVLRLTASDGALTSASDTTVTVSATANQAPIVSAGSDQTITLPASATLTGTATDDGLPAGAALITTWSKASGPGTVTFGSPNALNTTASFSAAGAYVLRLTASDSVLTSSATVTITVNAAAVPSLTAVNPSSGVQGTANLSAVITGANLAGVSGVSFSGSGVTASVNSATASSVSISITISNNAATGARTVTVTQPDGVSATLTNGFTVNPQVVSGGGSIIAPSRRTDWSQAGVQGGIPTRNTICTTLYPGATAADVNNAIASCPAGQVVQLAAGTFYLNSTINVSRSNITLRGQGMSTILNFTGVGGSSYFWGSALIALQDPGFSLAGYRYGDAAGAPALSGVPPWTVHAWTGTNGQTGVYTQGATVLNLDSAPTGLQVGDTLTLWQLDAPDNTIPNNGYFVSAKAGVDANNISWQGSTQSDHSGHQQRVKVVAINGSQVSISPGLYRPTVTWSTALGPKAGWQSTIRGVGLEDFRITKSFAGKVVQAIGFTGAADSWATGLGIAEGDGGGDYGIYVVDSRNLTIRNSWWDPFFGGGVNTTTSYGIMLHQASGCLIENNIFNGVESPLIIASGSTGNVISYNYENHTQGYAGGIQPHEEGPAMNLFEGNYSTKFFADVFHGNTVLNTIFRNHFYSGEVGVDLWSYHRWYNVIGNVVNARVYKSTYSDATLYGRWGGVAFRLGYASQNANGGVESGNVYPDPVVAPSTMLWGNWTTGLGAATWDTAEVPSGDPLFPNAIPSDHTLPPSLYLSSAPNWWPSGKAWPAIGPDVTGGNAAGFGGGIL